MVCPVHVSGIRAVQFRPHPRLEHEVNGGSDWLSTYVVQAPRRRYLALPLPTCLRIVELIAAITVIRTSLILIKYTCKIKIIWRVFRVYPSPKVFLCSSSSPSKTTNGCPRGSFSPHTRSVPCTHAPQCQCEMGSLLC
ncbi:hypothetical protein M404DRAFT_691862 [Pisolithus tinctorius Marx 270]|uniref:Uncharacterized protein n=1 Tax=Pisolithus tinctorius Marx 270 TaxID=870435 RepID=A0A0C3PV71_PISTI|nr:hypothetical protein M404DRAFT_691862 [Pisolithus tinctorius Marx 270]